MKAEFAYDSDLNGGSLMVRESRIVADLLLRGVSDSEWTQEIQIDNSLQKRSAATAERNARAILFRLKGLEPEFWKALRDGDDELATQVSFAAALDRNLLLVEFMEQVFKDLYVIKQKRIELYHWLDFLEDCGNRDKRIFGWKESTKKKMGQVVFRMLVEIGYLDSAKMKKLENIIVRPELREMLENTFRQRLLACMDLRI